VNRTAGSLDFFSDQTERLREKLAGSERELRDLKNATGLASLEQQREIQLKRAGQIEEDSLKAQAELAAVRAEIDARRKKLAVLPETIVTSEATGMANSARDVMREQLYALQLKEKSLLSQYQEDTFFIKSIRAEVAAAQAELDREPRLPHVTTGRNEAHQDMHRALLDQESLAESLAAKVQSLQVQLVEAQGNLKHLNDNEVRIAELTRRIDLETHNYRKYSENLEQARIDRALQDESISNLNILQPPTFSITPTRPRKLLNLALGLVVAVCASLATAVLAELLKPPAELNALDSTDSDPRALTSRLSGKHFAERVAINGS